MKYQIGDIFSCSWGYSMTIVDFYQVVETTKKGVYLRQIGSTEESTGYLCGYAMPIKDDFSGDKFYKLLCRGDTVKISDSQRAKPWDGERKYFNHCD